MKYQLHCVVAARDIFLETEDRTSLIYAATALHRTYGVIVQIVDTSEDSWVKLVDIGRNDLNAED